MSLFQDLRFGLRMTRKNPGFTAVAVAALALGIGANNTVFTLVNTILFKSLPFKDGHEIVSLSSIRTDKGGERSGVSYPDFQDWRALATSFQGMAAFSLGTMNVSDQNGVPERFSGAWLTASAFTVIGQSPILGRDFLPEEDRPGAQTVVLLGYGMWQDRYGGRPEILGKTIRVNSVPATVIGIMPQGMKFPFDAELWMPLLRTKEREARNYRDLQVFGRLAKGVTTARASSELKEIAGRLAKEYPKTNAGTGACAMSFNERYNEGRMAMVLWIMMGAVGFVLLIACVNVANLLLARAAYRSREISVRSAVGASRGRILRQLLIESLVLSLLGGVFGLLISVEGVGWFKRALVMANIEGMPYWLDFSMDWKVFGYLSAACVATSVLFGLVPALRAAGMNIVEGLKESGEAAGHGSRPRRMASSLVVAQLTLTLILVAGATMMIRDFMLTLKTSVGIRPENVLTMRLGLPEPKYITAADRVAFHEELLEKLQALAGVESVALTSNLPVDGAWTGRLQLEGQTVEEMEKLPLVPAVSVTPGYFRTLGTMILGGRPFDVRDGTAGKEVAIVNERFAARYWPGQDPLGKRIRLLSGTESPWLQVVGVVPQINREIEKDADFEGIAYVPLRQTPVRFVSIAARTFVPPTSIVQDVRRVVQAVDPDIPLYRIRTMQEHLSRQLWPYRVFGSLFAAFAVISLLLSAIGIYGVIAYSVSERTHEIGLRMALGADAGSVLRLILRQGTKQLLAGLVLGVIGAVVVDRTLEKLLIHTSASDPAVNMAGSLLLCVTALFACLIPAWRASRLDPLMALRFRK